MDSKDHQIFQQIARKTALYFARRCWWADVNELQSESYLSLVEFYNSPPPSFVAGHACSHHYAGTAASRHMSRWCFAQASPVSAPERSQRRERLTGYQRVSVDYNAHPSLAGNLEADIVALEAAALVPWLHAELRARLNALYTALYPDQSADLAEACIDVLAENTKSIEAADTHHVPVRTVYRHTERLIYRACRDDAVRELLTQLRESRGDRHDYHA